MKPDLYTKTILTVIALMLTVMVLKPILHPDIVATAQSAQFPGVQYTGGDFSMRVLRRFGSIRDGLAAAVASMLEE